MSDDTMHGDDRGLSNHGSRARRSGGGMPGDAARKNACARRRAGPWAANSNFMRKRRWTKAAPNAPGGPSWVIQEEDDVVRPRGMKHAPPDRGR
ncbi:hypothetical protein Bamb_6200 [Burkholderia ambifaria AMMD]|uniref:Uncharacterized protein n=1 Tax=Burkholderia ambifaria (strain ATCC BAA-244 / DSM 16087 / CCUG 44356 / LMG 19182 / AMMD) TaxID=339670 RepID=Q0B279_BURCM|nr:hypothetical protein Bamb_6200 [Burkholderia ambifaria AMMD]